LTNSKLLRRDIAEKESKLKDCRQIHDMQTKKYYKSEQDLQQFRQGWLMQTTPVKEVENDQTRRTEQQ